VIDVLAYIALVISLSTMTLCHQRQQFPGMAWLRRRAPRRTSQDSAPAPDPPDPPSPRTQPRRPPSWSKP
jgi:hypothetical protein